MAALFVDISSPYFHHILNDISTYILFAWSFKVVTSADDTTDSGDVKVGVDKLDYHIVS